MSPPLATVLVPARDEERWIDDCLTSIAAQDYPHDRMQVIVVVDGESSDATDTRAKELLDGCDFADVEVVRHGAGGTPGNLNAGLALARGGILCRVDARSRVPPDYVRRCVEILEERPEVAVTGGAQVAIASRGDALGDGIARALNNRWGMGLSRYRRGAASGPADTVYLGAFRTAQLREVGGWSEAFPTNQDFELNRRLAALGLVWFDAALPVGYVPRPDVLSLFRQYRRFGAWKVRYWRRTGDRPRPRQLALLVGVPAFAAIATAGLATGSARRRALAGAALVGAVAFVELRGSRGPRGGPAAHAWSALASGVVGAGWLTGAWGELARRPPSPDPGAPARSG